MHKVRFAFLSILLIGAMLLSACAPAVAPAAPAAAPTEAAAEAAPTEAAAPEAAGEGVPMVLMPKFLGILVFDQANQGAQEAHAEVGNPAELQFLGPTPENSVAGQIEILPKEYDAERIFRNRIRPPIRPARMAARARLCAGGNPAGELRPPPHQH